MTELTTIKGGLAVADSDTREIATPQHGHSVREMSRQALTALDGHGDPGKFGRMFPQLDPLAVGDDALFALAEAMKDDPGDDDAGDNPNIPAGFTYLGQFIDHDITLDTTPLAMQATDPLAVMNFRTPSLDLDSVYGQGPGVAPHLYQRDPANGFKVTPKLLIGAAAASPDFAGGTVAAGPHDLPRNSIGRALIGDERNDENLAVAQTHLAMLKFHNAVVDMLVADGADLHSADMFVKARRIVTWHYQWIALYDWVERLTEPGLVDRIRHDGRKYYRFKSRPYMPVEFSAAAYRLGHSMVREVYGFNRVFPTGAATLGLLFNFTGKSGNIVGDLAPDGATPPGPIADLPSNWAIDWNRFYDFPAGAADRNLTRRLDPRIVPALHTLPGEGGRTANLAFRNLKRGVQLGLPSGQDVARHMGVPVLSIADLSTGPDGAAAAAHGLNVYTPLWYYILKEAEVVHGGERLGPVGSTIIAETFLGLVHGDHDSFLWQEANWKPTLPGATPGKFTMVDLLNFVGDLNPVG